jgi:hypothetical protein
VLDLWVLSLQYDGPLDLGTPSRFSFIDDVTRSFFGRYRFDGHSNSFGVVLRF